MRPFILFLAFLLAGTAVAGQVSPAAARILNTAGDLIESKRYPEADAQLQLLIDGRGSAHEKALALRLLAWSTILQSRTDAALKHYETLLALPGLAPDVVLESMRNFVSLALQAGRHEAVVRQLNAYPGTREDVDLLLLLAQSQQALGQANAAASNLMAAMRLLKREGRPPTEQQLNVLRTLQQEANDWSGLRDTLEQLATRFPHRAYWLQLAETWRRLEQPERQAAILLLSYERGDLTTGEVRALAQLLMQQGNPLRAATLLRDALQSGELPATPQHALLQYQALWLARDRNAALQVLSEAVAQFGDADLAMRLAQHRLEAEEWEQAINVLRGFTGSRSDLLRGIALAKLGQHEEARSALLRARGEEQVSAEAREWLRYLEQ